MKKSISNIAWPNDENKKYLDILEKRGWEGIEIAPSRIWSDFTKISQNEIKQYKDVVSSFGLKICSIHSLFYGIQDAYIFGTDKQKNRVVEILKKTVELCEILESDILVLGSPSIRNNSFIQIDEAIRIASEVLRPAAEFAEKSKKKILIEPLSRAETSFINTCSEGMKLVEEINSDGFGLHFDAKSINDELGYNSDIITMYIHEACHFHANANNLEPIYYASFLEEMINKLIALEYEGYVSIEMRQTLDYFNDFIKSIDFIDKITRKWP